MKTKQKMVKEGVEVMIHAKIDSAVAVWLEKEKVYRNKGNVTAEALEFYYDYKFNKKGFLIRMIDKDFDEIKSLLRKIGSTRGQ